MRCAATLGLAIGVGLAIASAGPMWAEEAEAKAIKEQEPLSKELRAGELGAPGAKPPFRIVWIGAVEPEGALPEGVRFADWVVDVLRLHGVPAPTIEAVPLPGEPPPAGPGPASLTEAVRAAVAKGASAVVLVPGLDRPPRPLPTESAAQTDRQAPSGGEAKAAEDMGTRLRTWIEAVRRGAGETPLLVATSLPPVAPRGKGEPDATLAARAEAVKALREAAILAGVPCVDYDDLFRQVPADPGLSYKGDALLWDGRSSLLAARYAALSILWAAGLLPERPSAGDARLDRVLAILPDSPFRTIWSESLRPRLLARLKDPEAHVREDALERLLSGPGSLEPERLIELLEDPEPSVANRAQTVLGANARAQDSRTILLLEALRSHDLESRAGRRILALLEPLGRSYQRTVARAGPVLAFPPGAGEPESLEIDAELADRLAQGLGSRDPGVRRAASVILAAAGDPGLDRLFAAIPSLPEDLAVEQVQSLNARAHAARIASLIGNEKRPYVRRETLEWLVQSATEETPTPLLREVLTGNPELRGVAAEALAKRGGEGLAVLRGALEGADGGLLEVARSALLSAGLSIDDEDLARQCLEAFRASYGPEDYPELIALLREAVAGSVTRRGPSSRRVVMVRGRPTVRVSGNQPERLELFLPDLERALEKGDEAEREAAEEIVARLAAAAASTSGRGDPSSIAALAEAEAFQAERAKNRPSLLRSLRRLVAARPRNAAALNRLAWFLATAPDADLRDPKEAEALSREAIQIEDRQASFVDTLAAALAAQGRFEEAVNAQEEALVKAPDDAKPRYRERLELYRKGETYTASE